MSLIRKIPFSVGQWRSLNNKAWRLVYSLGLAWALASPIAEANPTPNQPQETAPKFEYNSALKASQNAIGRQLTDYLFTDSNGKPLALNNFRGKPLVLSLVYSSCYHICPMTTRHLAEVIEKARDALGTDSFNVATLGFDAPNDNPAAMRHFAKSQDIANKDWHLLSASQETIDAIAKDLGFVYFPSPNGFDHLIQASVIDPDGRIYRQVYGEVFETPLLVEPLKELVLSRPVAGQPFFADLVNKVRFFCTTYDPARDAYHFDYSLFIGMFIGGGILISTGFFIIRELLRRKQPPPA